MASFLRLAGTFDPLPGESLLGFLLRICLANKITPSELAVQIVGRTANEFAALQSNEENALGLSCLTGLDRAAIIRMMHMPVGSDDLTYLDHTVPGEFLDRTRMRYASGALATRNGRFHRSLWSLRLLDCDPTTGGRLRDYLPCCGRPSWWFSVGPGFTCRSCGISVVEFPAAPECSAQEIAHSRFWAAIYSVRPERAKEVRHSLAPELSELAPADLVRFAQQLQAGAGMKKSNLHCGTRLILDWPRSQDELTPTERLLARKLLRLSVPSPSPLSGDRTATNLDDFNGRAQTTNLEIRTES